MKSSFLLFYTNNSYNWTSKDFLTSDGKLLWSSFSPNNCDLSPSNVSKYESILTPKDEFVSSKYSESYEETVLLAVLATKIKVNKKIPRKFVYFPKDGSRTAP